MSYKENYHSHGSAEFKQVLPPKEHGAIPKAAAVAVINGENKALLMKRVPEHGGDWVYPGGAVDSGETFPKAARRETREESGILLDPKRNKLFPLANYVTAPDAFGTKHDLMVYIARYGADQPEPHLASPDEMTDLGWFDPQEAIDRTARGEMKISPSGVFAIRRAKEYLSDDTTKDYGEVLMGGTFDRLHPGHQQLLEKAFEVGDYVYIGVTTDEYIQKSASKKLKESVNSYTERLDRLRRHLDDKGVLNRTIFLPLEDTAGPKALDPKLGAIVVSEETKGGGQYVNARRSEVGVAPMDTVIVPLLQDKEGVISSTRLRQAELTNSKEQGVQPPDGNGTIQVYPQR